MARALIIVDVQNDFCEGGSLAVAGGAEVAAGVSAALAGATARPGSTSADLAGGSAARAGASADLAGESAARAGTSADLAGESAARAGTSAGGSAAPGGRSAGGATAPAGAAAGGRWDHVVATKDYHVDPGAHFGNPPDYIDSWPAHCVVGTGGADFHPALDTTRVEAVFTKGAHEAAYSGFQGAAGDTGLADWLRARDVTEVDVVGIATDHCVRATALDAIREGFTTTVLLDLTAGVAAPTTEAALATLRDAGAILVGHPILRA